jgi:hypothetical protein
LLVTMHDSIYRTTAARCRAYAGQARRLG